MGSQEDNSIRFVTGTCILENTVNGRAVYFNSQGQADMILQYCAGCGDIGQWHLPDGWNWGKECEGSYYKVSLFR